MSYVTYLINKIFSLFDNLPLKVFMTAWMFFAGIHTYIYAVGVLLILDVITGIYASILNKEKFTSKELKKGLLEKTALYIILLLAAFSIGAVLKTILHYEKFYVVFFVTVLICTYEMVSIFENILRINPKLSFISNLITITNKIKITTIRYAEKEIESIKIVEEEKVIVKKPDELPATDIQPKEEEVKP